MSTVRRWYEELDEPTAALVGQLVYDEYPDDEQLEEAVDLAEGYQIDALGLDADDRAKLEAAIAELAKRLHADDPRHRFLRMYDELELAERLQRFYREGEHAGYQHGALEGTEYAPYPLYVDFDAISQLMNPDFTGEMIGEQYIEFANLLAEPDGEPDDCYAHLAIDPQTTMVYLMEPSGNPELIAKDLDGLLARLKVAKS
jgi:hypothetical protein